jgi:uroporphyrinogen-III synthase
VGAGVVVTRDEGPDGPLTTLLRSRGLTVYRWPTIRVAPPEDPAPLESALADLDAFDWAVFTSPRAVAAVLDRADIAVLPSGIRTAAVGEATAGALERAGWPVTLVPRTQTGEALVAALLDAGMGAGTRVLFPASAIARDTVPDGLAEAGVVVVQVEAYRTEAVELDRGACRELMDSGAVAIVTFTSPSTVENLAGGLGSELFERVRRGARAVAIGPTTGDAAERAGFDVVVADPHSLEGLADRVAALAPVIG